VPSEQVNGVLEKVPAGAEAMADKEVKAIAA